MLRLKTSVYQKANQVNHVATLEDIFAMDIPNTQLIKNIK